MTVQIRRHRPTPQSLGAYHYCARCGGEWDAAVPTASVCPHCGWHFPYGPKERLRDLFDGGDWVEQGQHWQAEDPLSFCDRMTYQERLSRARQQSGLDEALLVGTGTLGGYPVVVAAFAFAFIGGSMGIAVGNRFLEAVSCARKHRWPLIVFVSSGGARMQEGVWSLVQMARVNAALVGLQSEGIGYITCLCHPTTGGVAASLAMLGDWVICEPGAYVSFTGARVLGVSSSAQCSDPESLLRLGHIDAIVPRSEQRSYLMERVAWYAA